MKKSHCKIIVANKSAVCWNWWNNKRRIFIAFQNAKVIRSTGQKRIKQIRFLSYNVVNSWAQRKEWFTWRLQLSWMLCGICGRGWRARWAFHLHHCCLIPVLHDSPPPSPCSRCGSCWWTWWVTAELWHWSGVGDAITIPFLCVNSEPGAAGLMHRLQVHHRRANGGGGSGWDPRTVEKS